MKVVDKFLMELESLLIDKNLSLNVSKLAKQKLFELGFDFLNGARPMARIIEQKIKIPLSEFILKSKEVSGEIKVCFNKKIDNFEINLESKKKYSSQVLNGENVFNMLMFSIIFFPSSSK